MRFRESLAAAALLALTIIVFLREPIRHFRDSVFAPADYLQQFTLTEVPGMGPPRNFLAGDTLQQFVPWALFSRRELSRGRVPLWNPFNGCGTPHLAAYQTAVFSPFSLPLYLLGIRAAMLAGAFLRLMALGLFTFLFLRRLGLAWTAALAGGIFYAFGGYHLIWLSGPESGTSAALPASLFFAETALGRLDLGRGRRELAAPLAGLSLSLAVGLLAGHPETFLVGLILLGAFILVRLLGNAAVSRAERLRRAVPAFAAAGILGAGLAAIQIVPFLEYLAHSTVGLTRAGIRPRGFVLPFLPLQIFPYLLGGPPRLHIFTGLASGTTFNEEVGGFVGPLALLLFGAGAILARRDRRMRFFLATGLVWFLWAYDVPLFSRLISLIPPIGSIADGRSATAWILVVSAGAAFGIDALLKLPRASLPRALSTLAAGGAVLMAAGAGGAWLLLRRLAERSESSAGIARAAFAGDLRSAVLTLSAGIAALALGMVLSRRWLRLAAGGLLAAAAYLQGGDVLSRYNPTVPARLLYARTPGISVLRSLPPGSRIMIIGSHSLPADANLGFGLSLASNYDGLWVARYDRLFGAEFGGLNWTRDAGEISARGLDLFGIDDVVVPTIWVSTFDTTYLEGLPMPGDHSLFRYRGGPGKFWVAARAIPAESAESSQTIVQLGNFDRRTEVVLECPLNVAAALTDLTRPAAPGSARVLTDEPGHLRLDVTSENRGVLVATLAFYPGWRALVDGRPAPVYAANAAFLGIPVREGHHVVDLIYAPVSWKIGVAASAVSLLVGAALLARTRVA